MPKVMHYVFVVLSIVTSTIYSNGLEVSDVRLFFNKENVEFSVYREPTFLGQLTLPEREITLDYHGISNGSATTNVGSGYSDGLRRGKALAVTGTVIWSIGKILEYSSIPVFVNGELEIGLTMAITGLVFDLIGPIFSAGGENIAKRSIGQLDGNGLNSHRRSAGRIYGLSWGMIGIGMLVSIIPILGPIASSVLGIVSEVLRGVAAIGPVVRISDYSARLSLVPNMDFKEKKYGVAFVANF